MTSPPWDVEPEAPAPEPVTLSMTVVTPPVSDNDIEPRRCKDCGAVVLWFKRTDVERWNRPMEELSPVIILDVNTGQAVEQMAYRYHHHTAAEVRAWNTPELISERRLQTQIRACLKRAYDPVLREQDEQAARARSGEIKDLRRQQYAEAMERYEWAKQIDCPIARCGAKAGQKCRSLATRGETVGRLTKNPHTDRLHQSPAWLAEVARRLAED